MVPRHLAVLCCAMCIVSSAPICGAEDRVHIIVESYIPDQTDRNPGFLLAGRRPAIRDPFGRCFGIDNASTSRLRTEFDVVVEGREIRIEPHGRNPVHQTGETHLMDCTTGQTLETRKASVDGMSITSVQKERFKRKVRIAASVGNPFFPQSVAPKIDYSMVIQFDMVTRTLSIDGERGTFPAFRASYRKNGGAQVRFIDHVPTGTAKELVDLWGAINTESFSHRIHLRPVAEN